jgi:hypothetical protein
MISAVYWGEYNLMISPEDARIMLLKPWNSKNNRVVWGCNNIKAQILRVRFYNHLQGYSLMSNGSRGKFHTINCLNPLRVGLWLEGDFMLIRCKIGDIVRSCVILSRPTLDCGSVKTYLEERDWNKN